jgi:hypothetical protein
MPCRKENCKKLVISDFSFKLNYNIKDDRFLRPIDFHTFNWVYRFFTGDKEHEEEVIVQECDCLEIKNTPLDNSRNELELEGINEEDDEIERTFDGKEASEDSDATANELVKAVQLSTMLMSRTEPQNIEDSEIKLPSIGKKFLSPDTHMKSVESLQHFGKN